MLTMLSGARIFVALGATDMRKSFDTLAQEARARLGEDPLSGSVFVFSNKSRTRVKVLWFDRGGFWLLARRLERGTFAWPKDTALNDKGVELRASELAALLDGIDLSGSRRRAWYERVAR